MSYAENVKHVFEFVVTLNATKKTSEMIWLRRKLEWQCQPNKFGVKLKVRRWCKRRWNRRCALISQFDFGVQTFFGQRFRKFVHHRHDQLLLHFEQLFDCVQLFANHVQKDGGLFRHLWRLHRSINSVRISRSIHFRVQNGIGVFDCDPFLTNESGVSKIAVFRWPHAGCALFSLGDQRQNLDTLSFWLISQIKKKKEKKKKQVKTTELVRMFWLTMISGRMLPLVADCDKVAGSKAKLWNSLCVPSNHFSCALSGIKELWPAIRELGE